MLPRFYCSQMDWILLIHSPGNGGPWKNSPSWTTASSARTDVSSSSAVIAVLAIKSIWWRASMLRVWDWLFPTSVNAGRLLTDNRAVNLKPSQSWIIELRKFSGHAIWMLPTLCNEVTVKWFRHSRLSLRQRPIPYGSRIRRSTYWRGYGADGALDPRLRNRQFLKGQLGCICIICPRPFIHGHKIFFCFLFDAAWSTGESLSDANSALCPRTSHGRHNFIPFNYVPNPGWWRSRSPRNRVWGDVKCVHYLDPFKTRIDDLQKINLRSPLSWIVRDEGRGFLNTHFIIQNNTVSFCEGRAVFPIPIRGETDDWSERMVLSWHVGKPSGRPTGP
jgi:hypothetical protein